VIVSECCEDRPRKAKVLAGVHSSGVGWHVMVTVLGW